MKSIALGGFGFALVSVAAYSVWAFVRLRSEVALYSSIALVFLGLSGLVLHRLMHPPRRMVRFYLVFVPAFLAYAAAWSGCWFATRSRLGEWAASLAGSVAFTAVAGVLLGRRRGWLVATGVLFAAHSAGYFLGGWAYEQLHGSPALPRLSWGFCHGLGFGAGLGFVFHSFQKEGGRSA